MKKTAKFSTVFIKSLTAMLGCKPRTALSRNTHFSLEKLTCVFFTDAKRSEKNHGIQ